jgi:hypothetical protein
MPVPVLVAWIAGTPFAVMGAVAWWPALRRGLERFYWPSLVVGWTGFALVALGALMSDVNAGTVAMVVGAPLLGLCVWVRRDPDDEEPTESTPDPGEPHDTIDWDRFMRDLDDWSARERSGAAR